MISGETILETAESLLPDIIRIRRSIHQYPELSYQEHKTASLISDRLKAAGIEHVTGIAGTGIVGIIRGEADGRGLTAALRADMDALPVTESAGKEYRSLHDGIMHACGHDAHVAMLLAAALIINSHRSKLAGNVLLVFQPGEEKAPGGASLMIASGIFERYRPDFFIAQHIAPELPSGMMGFCAGPAMASSDEIYITVKGRGGHAARPTEYTDQIYIASELVISLRKAVESAGKEKAPTILGIGKISGLGATNVIPETVDLECTLRTFDEEWRQSAKDLIRGVASEVAAKYGVTIDVKFVEGYPVLINNEELTARASKLCETLAGKEKVRDIPSRMGSEDFSFFAEKYPAVLYRLGSTPDGRDASHLHTSDFDIDESVMATGSAAMAWLALNLTTERESV
jgi:amidohydrolase